MAGFGFLMKYSFKTIAIISVVIIVLASVVGFYLAPMLIDMNLKGLNLKPGSDMRKLWEKTPFPLTLMVYIFNITNPMEVVQGKKPRLQQIGPYVFNEWKSKNVISDDDNEDSVTFDLINTYTFRPDLTHGLTGDEVVTVPHMMLMGGLIAAQRDRPGLLGIVIQAFQQIFEPEGTPFLTTKVMDLLFNGVGVDCNREDLEASIVCPQIANEKNIKKINDTYFTISLFGESNGTSLGKYKVYRGVKDVTKVGQVITFEDSEVSKVFKGDCGKINGTDGTIFAPFHKKKDTFYSFSPVFCRSIGPVYKNEASYNSVPTSVYNIQFGDFKSNPSQHCFCRDGDPEKCPPKGTIDNYACMGVPMIMSKPHFLDADRNLLKAVDGLKPSKKLHDNYLQFEMQSGSPVSVKNRIQFALQIEKIEDFDLMANMEPAIVPIFWIEESLDLPAKITNVMRYGIYLFQTIISIIKYSGIIIGLIGIFFAAYRSFDKSAGTKVNVPIPVIENPLSGVNLQSRASAQKY
ncbi:hypothetical protein ACKWTF_006372 [Chironomus riparius]